MECKATFRMYNARRFMCSVRYVDSVQHALDIRHIVSFLFWWSRGTLRAVRVTCLLWRWYAWPRSGS